MSDQPLWRPSPERAAATQLHAFRVEVERRFVESLPDFAALHAWSVADRAAFWSTLWDFCGVVGERGERAVVDAGPHARRPLVSRRAAELRREPAAAARRNARADRARRARRAAHVHLGGAARRGVARRAGAARRSACAPAIASRAICRTARGDRRDARHGQSRRGLVVVLAGLRRAGRRRPLRPDRAERALRLRRLLATPARPTTCASARRGARVAAVRPTLRGDGEPRSAAGARGSARRDALERVHRSLRAGTDRVRAAALRSPALHPLLLGHDRRAQVHRPRRRRHAAPAPQGASAALPICAPATASSTSPRSAG